MIFASIFLVRSQIAVIFGSILVFCFDFSRQITNCSDFLQSAVSLFFAVAVLFVPPGTLSCYFAQSAECDRWLDLKLGAARELRARLQAGGAVGPRGSR